MCLSSTAKPQAPTRITLDQAVELALAHSHTLKASQMQIQQNQSQEITAALRPNPTLTWDSLFIPVFSPSNFGTDELTTIQQFDIGASYLFERGRKRRRRIDAAKDATAVTRYQVLDNQRALIFNEIGRASCRERV